MASHKANEYPPKLSQTRQDNDFELEERAQLLSPTRQSTLTDSKGIFINDLPPLDHVEPNNEPKGYMERPPPVNRKYSAEWWRANWEDAVEARFWARVVYFSVAGIIMAVWIFVM